MKMYVVGYVACDPSVELDSVNDLRDLSEDKGSDGTIFFNKNSALTFLEDRNNPKFQIAGVEEREVMIEVDILSFTAYSASPKLKTVKVKK